MDLSFEYQGYKYTQVPKEEIPAYAEGDNNIFVICIREDFLSERGIVTAFINKDIDRIMKQGLLFQSKQEKLKWETRVKEHMDFFKNIWGFPIKNFICFVGQKAGA